MNTYKELDKSLKKIRNNREYDLYETNLESQKTLDQFYDKDISENDMIGRKYQLDSYLHRRNMLYFPIIITVIFGILVNAVFKKFEEVPNFVEMFQILWSEPIWTEDMQLFININIMIIFLFVVMIGVFAMVFFIPFPPLLLIFSIGQDRIYQTEYELRLLEKELNKALEENKKGKEYRSNIRKKINNKYLLLSITMITISIVVGISWNIPLYKVLVLDIFCITGGYFISKICEKK